MKPAWRIAAACAALCACDASAEPATADPAYLEFDERRARRGFPIADAIFLSAHGRAARLDTADARDAIGDARAMGKFLPGYPQPALVTFDIEVHF